MTFSNSKDKQEIKLAFNLLLMKNGYTLRSWCNKHIKKYPYRRTYERLSRNKIELKDINAMIATIDETLSLQRINDVLVIEKSK